MAKQIGRDAASVDVILQNLARRPNVSSTLILSRNDGSIIKASGSIADDAENRLGSRRLFTGDAVAVDSSGASMDTADSKEDEKSPSRAETLARHIHAFVESAVTLGASIQEVDDAEGHHAQGIDAKNGPSIDSGRANQLENDIQLLRLRLKRQEVIVFPDLKYLCCVVQDLDKITT